MLDGHDAGVGEDLLGEVVNELAIDEAVDAVVDDVLALLAHLVLLRRLHLGHLKAGTVRGEQSGNRKGTFRDHSGDGQGTFRGHSRSMEGASGGETE